MKKSLVVHNSDLYAIRADNIFAGIIWWFCAELALFDNNDVRNYL